MNIPHNSLANQRIVGEDYLCVLFLLINAPKSCQSGNDQNTNSNAAGYGNGLGRVGTEICHIACHNGGCSALHTGTGQQRNNGNDQIGDRRIFADPRHNFGIGGGKKGCNKICHHTVNMNLTHSENSPAQSTAQGA